MAYQSLPHPRGQKQPVAASLVNALLKFVDVALMTLWRTNNIHMVLFTMLKYLIFWNIMTTT